MTDNGLYLSDILTHLNMQAAYVINGNSKNIMNMAQADQFDLWQSLVKGSEQ